MKPMRTVKRILKAGLLGRKPTWNGRTRGSFRICGVRPLTCSIWGVVLLAAYPAFAEPVGSSADGQDARPFERAAGLDELFPCSTQNPNRAIATGPDTNPYAELSREVVNNPRVGPQILCALTADIATPASTTVAQLLLVEVPALRGYQTTLAITRTSGSGTVTVNCPGGVAIDTGRPDFVFAGLVPGMDFFTAINCPNGQAAASRVSGGTVVGSTPAYLSHSTLTVSADATPGSTFEVAIVGASSFLVNPTGGSIAYTTGPPCTLTVVCGMAADCADGNPCTTDLCQAGDCVHEDNSDPCEDGLFCTVNDVCAGGACSGMARDCSDSDPCTADTCDEVGDQCVHRLGDANGDVDIDLDDYAALGSCLSGPGGGYVSADCCKLDFDRDGDVDLADFAEFSIVFMEL